MNLIDTHTHLYLPEFDNDRDEAVKRATQNGVTNLLMPNIDMYSIEAMLSAEDRYSGICHPMIGLHPTSVKEDYPHQLNEIEKVSREHDFIAVGEIGIDLYWDKTFLIEQLGAFRRQIVLALSNDLPVVIHSREAFSEIFSVLDEFRGKGLRGVFHAFSGDLETAERAIADGFKLGIGGIVTFRNSGLNKVIRDVDPVNLVIETDSPYLAPDPYRGKRNESAYLDIICRKLAEIYEVDEEKIAGITTDNARCLFNI
jgi:TatD DNase family protein